MDKNRTFVMAMRQALLMVLDAMERWLEIEPRTAQVRKEKRFHTPKPS